MSDSFEKTINGHKYFFQLINTGNESYYNVSFDYNDKHETFELKKDAAGHWRIQTSPLPLPRFINNDSLDFNDAVEENINDASS